jgi:hypothetical protein
VHHGRLRQHAHGVLLIVGAGSAAGEHPVELIAGLQKGG